MTEEDEIAVEKVLVEWAPAYLGDVRTIAIHSPTKFDIDLMTKIFPRASQALYSETNWDLNKPCPDNRKFDLFFVANTLMASPDVDLWLDNIFKVSKFALVQELIRAWRNGHEELSKETGDICRFTFPPHQEARVPGAYDLNKLGDRLLNCAFYQGKPGIRKSDGKEMDGMKFIGLITGPLPTKSKLPEPPVVGSNHGDQEGSDVSKRGAKGASKTNL